MKATWRCLKATVIVLTPIAIIFGLCLGVFWALGQLLERSL